MKSAVLTLCLCFAVFLCAASSSKALAAFEFIKPGDSSQPLGKFEISAVSSVTTKSVIPEPTTLILFGSGLFSMLIGFFRRTYALTKRATDIAGSMAALALFSPIFLFTAVLIRLVSKGPIFYTQVRVGKDGKHFHIYKFRTMHVDAEKSTGPVWAVKNDHRLIPLGRLIRKAHLDEIPQFINVLQGDMSIIGPRPERPVFVEQFKKQIADYHKRLEVKPGITGLAQVWHRYDETMADVRKKIKYDLLYMKKMCFWTDLRILLRTVRVVCTGAGSH